MLKKIITGLLLVCTCALFALVAPSALCFETAGFSDLTSRRENVIAGTVNRTLQYYMPLIGSKTESPCNY